MTTFEEIIQSRVRPQHVRQVLDLILAEPMTIRRPVPAPGEAGGPG